MAGETIETYLDAIVSALDTNKATIGIESVKDSIDYAMENELPSDEADYPIALVDIGQNTLEPDPGHIYTGYEIEIWILVSLAAAKQKTADYRTARATAYGIERKIRGYLRSIQHYEEPMSIASPGGPVNLGDRHCYGVIMSIRNITPERDPV